MSTIRVPDSQARYPARVRNSLRDCLAQGIEVAPCGGGLTLREGRFPCRHLRLRLDQPYRDYAVDLLRPEHPKDGGEAYDDISWSCRPTITWRRSRPPDPQVRAANLTATQRSVLIRKVRCRAAARITC